MKILYLIILSSIIINVNNISYAQTTQQNNSKDDKPEISNICGFKIPEKIIEKENLPETQCLNYIKIKDKASGYVGLYYGIYTNGTYCVTQSCTGQISGPVSTNVAPKPMGCKYILWGKKDNGKLVSLSQTNIPILEINYIGIQNNMPYFKIKYVLPTRDGVFEDIIFYSDFIKKYK